MTALELAALAGMMIMAGLLLTALALRPPAPRLASALAQLDATPTISTSAVASSTSQERWTRLATYLERLLGAHLGVSNPDLNITGYARAQLALRKLLMAGLGLLLPTLTTVGLSLIGTTPPWILPAGVSILLAATLWIAPSHAVREQASAARAEFRAALTAFLALVGLERRAGGSVTEALEAASRISYTWPFELIHAEVLEAQLNGSLPWDRLRQLGDRLGIEELRNLATVAATAADGAAIFSTLLAEARSLRAADLAAQQERANVATEHIGQPVTLLSIGYVLLIAAPAILRLFAT